MRINAQAKLVVVILAGGEGKRMNGGKPLKRLGGRRLIDCALEKARQWSDMVAVSVRDPTQVESINATLVTDEPGVEGPLAGLISGLRFADTRGCELVLTIPTDMPFLPSDLPDRLSADIGRSSCALAKSAGHLHPVCALWRTSALDSTDSYLASGQRSLRGMAELIGFSSVEWALGTRDPFYNINTADDLACAGRLI